MTNTVNSPFGKQITLGGVKSDKNTWTSTKVDRYLYNLENGIDQDHVSPFYDRKIGLRKGNLNFQYTKSEEEELEKCMKDVIYFANKYAHAMTDTGVKKITLRDYQRSILKEFQNNRYVIFLASRQIGKCCLSTTKIMVKCNNQVKRIQISSLFKSNSLLKSIKNVLYKLFDKLK